MSHSAILNIKKPVKYLYTTGVDGNTNYNNMIETVHLIHFYKKKQIIFKYIL